MNGENIEIIVNFSRKIQPSSVHIVIKSLYRHKKQDIETNFYMIDDSTLKFSIPVKTARTIGFYGINLKAGGYDNFPVKELDITYFQPDNRKSK